MRTGPHPLPMHLGMAAANLSGIQRYASNFDSTMTHDDAVQMMRGIKMYQEHTYYPPLLPVTTILKNGCVEVRQPIIKECRIQKNNTALLLVPSLINRETILDITEQQSMLRWFCAQGIDAYILDWGDFIEGGEPDVNMDTLISLKLYGAIKGLSEKTGKEIDVMGYCMSGALLLAAHRFASDHIRRMILLASPWDMHAPSYELARHVRIWSQSTLPIIRDKGVLPAYWLQALFASIDPNGSAQKFIKFASMDQDSSEAKLFVSIEDWLNGGRDLPGAVASHCIQDWFLDNKPALGSWVIGKKEMDIENIKAKVLIVASSKDRLVSFDSAMAVQKQLSSALVDTIDLDCGHIGVVAGQRAKTTVWSPMHEWLMEK